MKYPYILLVGLLIACQPTPQDLPTKEKLAQHKVMATLWFQQSAEMEAAYLQAYHHAKILLTSKLDTLEEGIQYGVVLDIDETVLDNSPAEVILIQEGDIFSSDNWEKWTTQARARALPGALDFVNSAMRMGIEVFYISNRSVKELDATLENLNKHSFPNADSTHVFLKKVTSDKTERRAKVSEKAEIILYIGDNLRDYSEIFGERGSDMGKGIVHSSKEDWLNNFVILPNPTYGEWEKAVYGNTYSLTDEEKLQKRLEILEN